MKGILPPSRPLATPPGKPTLIGDVNQTLSNLQSGINKLKKKISGNELQTARAIAASNQPSVAPLPLLSIGLSEAAIQTQSATKSAVTVTWVADPNDTNYGYVNFSVVGYHGSTKPVLVASGVQGPITFILDTTGETITVQANPVSLAGLVQEVATTGTVTLNGITTNPPAPTIAQYVIASPNGAFQFIFNQVTLPGGDQDVIKSYNVYRNTSNSTSGATVIRTIAHDPTNVGNPIVVQDIVNKGTAEYYWVTSVNTKGLESTKTAAQTGTPTTYQAAAATSQVVLAQSQVSTYIGAGRVSISYYTAGNTVYLPGIFAFDVVVKDPTHVVVLDMLLFASNGGTGPFGYFFRFDSRSGSNAGQILNVNNGSWSSVGTAKASANAANLPVGIYHVFGEWNIDGAMNIYVNGVWQYTYQDNTYTPTGATYYVFEEVTSYAAPTIAPYKPNWATFGSGELLAQGSISAAGNGTFSYVSTTTTIKWTWSSFSIYNPDGSTITVPANSGGTTFSSLTANTTYYFDFYVTVATGVCTVVLSDQSSGTAKSSVQYLAQTINGDGNVGIAWNVAGATPSSGSGGGGGSYCFSGNVAIKTPDGFVPFEQLPRDRDFPIVNETGIWPARLIVHENFHEVMVDMGNGELVTMGHLIKNTEGRDVAAIEVFPDAPRVEFSGTVYNLAVRGEDHHYILENGTVCHNQKIGP